MQLVNLIKAIVNPENISIEAATVSHMTLTRCRLIMCVGGSPLLCLLINCLLFCSKPQRRLYFSSIFIITACLGFLPPSWPKLPQTRSAKVSCAWWVCMWVWRVLMCSHSLHLLSFPIVLLLFLLVLSLPSSLPFSLLSPFLLFSPRLS